MTPRPTVTWPQYPSRGGGDQAMWTVWQNLQYLANQLTSGVIIPTGDSAWSVIGAVGQPAFQNSWVNFDATRVARFRKTSDGMVILTGIIASGTIGLKCFTLPVGYRPPASYGVGALLFSAVSNGAAGGVLIQGDGVCIPFFGNNTYVSLDGINFFAEG